MIHTIPKTDNQIDQAIDAGLAVYNANGVTVNDGSHNLSSKAVQTDMTSTDDAIPTSKAVLDKIAEAGGGDMLKEQYDPNNEVYNAGGIPSYAVPNLTTLTQTAQTFHTRRTGSGLIGQRRSALMRKVLGNTVKVNQLVPTTEATETNNGITYTNGGNGTWTLTGTATGSVSSKIVLPTMTSVANHKYLLVGGNQNASLWAGTGNWQGTRTDYGAGTIITAPSAFQFGLFWNVATGTVLSNLKLTPMFTDLTSIFGAGNEPATVDQFKSWLYTNTGKTLDEYIAYTQGTLVDFGGELKSTGKNLFRGWIRNHDELSITTQNKFTFSTNVYNCAGKTFTVSCPNTPSYNASFRAFFYDWTRTQISYTEIFYINQNYTFTVPNNAEFLFLRAGSNGSDYAFDLSVPYQIELSSTATTYEPYTTHSVTFPTLRKAGSVQDSLNIDADGWARSVTRNVGTYTFTGSETLSNFTNSANGDYGYYEPSSAIITDIHNNVITASVSSFSFDDRISIVTEKRLIGADLTNKVMVRGGAGTTYTAATLAQAFAGVVMNYILATPYTESITPIFVGYACDNNGTEAMQTGCAIVADIDYVDTKTAVDKAYAGVNELDAIKQPHFFGLNHNGIYRGTSLGTVDASNIDTFLAMHEVSTGKFKDIYLGDEIVIKDGTYNATWIVAGFDTEWNKGDTALTTHHVSLIPKTYLLNAVWHASGTPAGYWGSDIRATCDTIASNLANALSSHLLTRKILTSTAISTSGASMAGGTMTGYASNWGWKSARATLLTEVQVYGATVLSSSFYDTGEGYEKLPVFNFLQPCTRASWWLRSVASSSIACRVSGSGCATDAGVFSDSCAVRPLICIG